MRILFWLYLVAYVAFSAFGIVDSAASGRAPLLLMVEIVAVLLSVAGMLIYWLGWSTPRLRAAWKFVFVFLILDLFITGSADFRDLRQDPELTPPLLFITLALSLLFMFPSFWMNGKLAFRNRRPTK